MSVSGRAYSRGEEIANSVTHGAGVFFGLLALVLLVVSASLRGTVWHIVSCAIYGSTLLLMFTASTLYHSLSATRARVCLKAVDHASIYLLIAGTYTPFLLVTLRGAWGWSLFGVAWGLAVLGVLFKALFAGRFRLASTLIYIGMGWMVLIAIRPLMRQLSPVGIRWLLLGGAAYTLGTVFYLIRRIPFGHAVWHAFVLAGSICHFVAVMRAVIPHP